MKNKKANLDIVVFVIMVLIICVYALIQFTSYNEKLYFKITGYEKNEEILLEKKDLEYRLEKYFEECTIKSYAEMIKNKEFYEEKEVEGIFFFYDLKNNTTAILNEKTTTCLKEIGGKDYASFFENYEKKPFLGVLLSKLKNKEFKTNLDEQNLEIIIEKFLLTKISDKEMKYETNLSSNISFKKIGLLSFKEINETLMLCKKDTTCIKEKTKNLFEVKLEEKSENKNNKKIFYNIYKFSSLKEFYINEKFEKISFEIKVLDKIEEQNS